MGVYKGTSSQQTFGSQISDKMAWHKGTWWPLAVKEWYAPKASQHMFDPYSALLLVVGLLFHLLWGTDDIDSWIYGFLLALGLELVWEIIGNSKFVLKRIRENSGTSGEYLGDSIQNIAGAFLAALELWWISLVVIIISEVACIIYMRDSLLLTVITLFVHSEKLKQWQLCKLPEVAKTAPSMWSLWRTTKKTC